MFHTAGCVIATLGPLWIGGTVILVDRFDPAPVLQALRTEKASVLFYVPAVLAALLEAQRASNACAPQLHTIMGGASNVPPALIEAAEQVFGATVINLFGQTELSPVLTATRPEDARADRLNTVGRPLPQVDCRIVDPVSGEVVGVGEPGEICARGYQAFVGYLHDPDATARAIDDEGFVHTGDLGTMDSRGYLTVTGRLKELIIRGGENIAPAEIESHLIGHDDVVDCAVVGLARRPAWRGGGRGPAHVPETPTRCSKTPSSTTCVIAWLRSKFRHGGFLRPSFQSPQRARCASSSCETRSSAATCGSYDSRRQTSTPAASCCGGVSRCGGRAPCRTGWTTVPNATATGPWSSPTTASSPTPTSRPNHAAWQTVWRPSAFEAGDRVAMVMANYPEFVAIKFAIARAGAIAVPLNYLYRSEELRFVLADSGCRVVVTMTGFARPGLSRRCWTACPIRPRRCSSTPTAGRGPVR